MPVYAIVVAGGKGKRFGGLKQFYKFRGRPILYYSLNAFEKNEDIDSIIVVVPKNIVKKTKRIVKDYNLKKIDKIVPGGKRRQDSVLNGIKAIDKKSSILVIHDGVRPFVSQKLIRRGIRYCKKYKAVIFGLPIYDTVKYVEGRMVKRTLSRKHLYTIQTPEFFLYDYLMAAYKKVDFKEEYTDEASILESAGLPVYLFKGERQNIKITNKEDLKFLR